MTVEFSWSIRPGYPVATVEVAGELDLESGAYLHELLRRILQAGGSHLAIDLSGVTFIDCSGMNALLASWRDARRLGGWLRVVEASRCVRRVVELTGLQRALGVSPEGPRQAGRLSGQRS
jgi:anti-sigma B factor antagonist